MGGQSQQKAFDQVKSILGRLDRNIDAARAKRLTVPTGGPSASTMPSGAIHGSQLIGESTSANTMVGTGNGGPLPLSTTPSTTPPAPGGPTQPGRSPFGRATPIRIARPNGMTGS